MLLTLLSEGKSLTATEFQQNLWLEYREGLPPPATKCQTFPNIHAALIESVFVCSIECCDGVVLKCPADTWFSHTPTLDALLGLGSGNRYVPG